MMSSESMTIETSSHVSPVPVLEIIPDLALKIASQHKREDDLMLDVCEAHLFVPGQNLAKIVEELVDNAFKFSQPGSPVTVKGQSSGSHFQLVISDQGRGMSSEDIAKIGPHMQFERKTYEQQGAGLGLVIAKRLTELLGGQFKINSRPDQGATVTLSFHLPAHQ